MSRAKHIKQIARSSQDLTAEHTEALRAMLPEVFIEDKIDFERLRAALGEQVDERSEQFSLNWAGKRECLRLLQTVSRASLAPDRQASVEFDTTRNLFIEGENLEVLKLLQASYFGRVKMIYIDPPYNTGKDFIYTDNYAAPRDAYLKLTAQTDERGRLLNGNPETNGRYHSGWLSMMCPRLYLARRLLRDDGVIFASIDDHEVHNLKHLMNEVFGEENFLGQIVVQLNPRGRHLERFLAKTHEYVLVYARDATRQPLYELEKDERMMKEYRREDGLGKYRELELRNRTPAFNRQTRPNLYYPIYADPQSGEVRLEVDERHTVQIYPRNSLDQDSCWRWSKKKFLAERQLVHARQTKEGRWRVFHKDYLLKPDGRPATTLPKALWTEKEIHNDYGKKALRELFGAALFDFPKPPALIEKMLRLSTKDEDLVLDFFAGSGTTAQAVMELNRKDGHSRRFILIQLPAQTPPNSNARKAGYETLSQLGRERVRRLIEKLEGERASAQETRVNLDVERAGAEAARLKSEDLGFKFFRLAASNFKECSPLSVDDAGSYQEQSASFKDSLVQGWRIEDVIYEVAIREGYELNSSVERVDRILENAVYRVTDEEKEQRFYICLDEELHPSTHAALGLCAGDLFICRDSSLSESLFARDSIDL